MPTTPPPTLSVQFPTPSSFSAHRARSHTLATDVKGPTLSGGALQAALDAPTSVEPASASATSAPPASAKRSPPRPLSLHARSGSGSASKQHTPSALLSPYGAPLTAGGQPRGRHAPRHSFSGGLPSAGPPTGTAAEVARQRGLAIAVVKRGENNVVLTPGLPSAALKSGGLKSAVVKPLATPRTAEGLSGSGRKETIILCKYYHTPGLTCTSRPCRFVHDLKSTSSPLPSPSLFSMLSPTAIPSPTAGTFAAAQATAPLRRLSMNEDALAKLRIGETVVLHDDEQGEDVVGEVYVMSGGGAGLAGKTNKKFKTERCRDFEANGECPYGEYCSFLHGDEPQPQPQASKDNITLNEKRERTAPGFNAWLDKIPKTIYDPKPGALWAEDAVEAAGEKLASVDKAASERKDEPALKQSCASKEAASKTSRPPTNNPTLKQMDRPGKNSALRPKSVNDQTPATLRKPAAWTNGPRPKALQLEKQAVQTTLMTPALSSGMKSSTVEPPQSACATESDPATPWNPEQRAEDEAEAAAYAVAHAGMEDAYQPVLSDLSWEGYLVPPPTIAGVAVVWTNEGWTVQEAAAAAALETLDPAGGIRGRKPKSYYRTRPCKFFSEGYCPHGETCSYQHVLSKPSSPSPPSEPELATPGEGRKVAFASAPRSDDGSQNQRRRPHPLHKTQPCKFFNSAAGCTNGETCAFLHERILPIHAPLVEKPRPWRTRPCRHFQTATCHAGDLCHFAHVADPLFKPSAAHLHRDPLDPNVSPAKPCSHWVKTGKCSFGDKCKFVHPIRRKQSMDDHPHLLPSAPVVLWPVSPTDEGTDDDSDSDDDVQIEINPIATSPLRV